MALLGRTEVNLRNTSRDVTVPNTPRARLMYYLNCVLGLLDINEPGSDGLRQYGNHRELSGEDTDRLIVLAYLLSPDVLLDKCIFHSEELCGDSSNKFFELSLAQTQLAVTNSIMIGGVKRQVRSIMVFKLGWIEKNWADPIKTLVEERQRAHNSSNQTQAQRQIQTQNSDDSGCCCIIL